MKKILIVLVSILVLAVLAITVILPRNIAVEREIVIETSADKIYPHINNLKKWQKWNPWLAKDPDMKITYEGPEAGVGAKYAWVSETQGSGNMEITKVAENRMIETALKFDGQGDSQAIFTLEKAGENKTKVIWHLASDMGANPIGKVFGMFMDGMVGPDFEDGLKRMKTTVESGAQNEPETKEPTPEPSATPSS